MLVSLGVDEAESEARSSSREANRHLNELESSASMLILPSPSLNNDVVTLMPKDFSLCVQPHLVSRYIREGSFRIAIQWKR